MLALVRYIFRTFIWLIILAGIIVAGLRLALANVDLFRADIENWVAEEFGPGISFGKMQSYWIGPDPVLELTSAAVTLPDRSKPLAIDAVNIQFNLWGSLVLGIPVVTEISGNIETVTIRKDIEKRWWFNDIQLIAEKGSGAASDIEDLIGSIPHYLQLVVTRLVIEDQISQQNYQVDNIAADIQHHDDATYFQLLAKLPEALGGELKVKSIMTPAQGLVYFQSDQLKLEPLLGLIGLPTVALGESELSGEAWLRLSEYHIQGLDANIAVDQLNYRHDELDAIPARLSLQMNANRQEKNWVLKTRVDDLFIDEYALSPLSAQIRFLSEDQQRHLHGWLDGLDLEAYLPVVQRLVSRDFADQLQKSELQGRLQNIWFSLPENNLHELKVSATLSEFANKTVDQFPGVDKVNAEIVYSRQQSRVNLKSTQLTLDFADNFRAPLQIDEFAAIADSRFDDNGMTISITELKAVNQDIRLAGRAWIEVDEADTPFMSMRLEFDDGNASQKSKYLPVKLLPKSALDWIDNGIRSADISGGEVLFHGRLDNIEKLDRNQSGGLFVRFNVDNAEVMFEPDWLVASKGKGTLLFHNLGADIQIDSISYDQIENARASIQLPSFLNTVIIADIDAVGPVEKALPTWLDSPVGEDYREIASNLTEPGGNVSSNIKLSIPLDDATQKAETNVRINFDNASIKAPVWGINLSRINGKVLVDNNTISADGIQAVYFDDPVVIDIATDQSSEQTLVKTSGQLDTRQLLNLLPEAITDGLQGKSQWNVDLAIENRSKTGLQPILKIEASSSLKGSTVLLPEPFRKSPAALRQTRGEIALLANGEMVFDVQYGKWIKTNGRLEKVEPAGLQLADLTVSFSDRPLVERASGIRVHGRLPKLPLDDWIGFYRVQAAKRQPGSRSLLPLLKQVDLTVSEATVLGRLMENADFHLQQSADGFAGNIDSSIVKGQFDFPHNQGPENPVLIDLEYARVVRTAGKSSKSGLIPNDLFNLRMRSKEFVYDEKLVTDFEFDASIDSSFLVVDNLVFHRDDITFQFNGYWVYSPPTKQHETRLIASINGSEFGQAMAKLNFGDTIHNGDIQFQGEISWPDELFRPDWDILSGKGRIRLDDGILKNVEPGSGRFVGLLSLNALPRRLSLDFSDVLFEGMEFDDIQGDLVLDGQNLYTSNTIMDGPAAEIKITGRTGLRDRDYDQKIYIVPKIRQTLPLIGGIAAGSTIGWGLLLLQNLFKSSIDDSVAIEYSMTGSWDDPQLILLNEPPPEPVKEKKEFRNLEK